MLPVPGEQKLVAACIVAIQCIELCLLNTSQVVENCGKRSKAKAGPLVENSNESDCRTTDRSSHKLVQAAVESIRVLSQQSSAVSAMFITYSLTCAEP